MVSLFFVQYSFLFTSFTNLTSILSKSCKTSYANAHFLRLQMSLNYRLFTSFAHIYSYIIILISHCTNIIYIYLISVNYWFSVQLNGSNIYTIFVKEEVILIEREFVKRKIKILLICMNII